MEKGIKLETFFASDSSFIAGYSNQSHVLFINIGYFDDDDSINLAIVGRGDAWRNSKERGRSHNRGH